MKFLTIEKEDISNLISMSDIIEMCEKAYVLTSEKNFINYPRTWLKSEHGGLMGTVYAKYPGYLTASVSSICWITNKILWY